MSGSLLQGLIVDRRGRTMGPVHTTRMEQRFRCYVTHPKSSKDGPGPYRLAAEELERHCTSLRAGHHASEVASIADNERAVDLARVLRDGPSDARRDVVVEHVRRVIIGDAELTIELASGAKLHRSLERVRHGNDVRLIVGEVARLDTSKADPQLIILLRDAHRAQALAIAQPSLSLNQLAAKFGRSSERSKRLIRLSYLSPYIIAAIIEARQPAHLTGRFFQHLDGLPMSWTEQEQLLLA